MLLANCKLKFACGVLLVLGGRHCTLHTYSFLTIVAQCFWQHIVLNPVEVP